MALSCNNGPVFADAGLRGAEEGGVRVTSPASDSFSSSETIVEGQCPFTVSGGARHLLVIGQHITSTGSFTPSCVLDVCMNGGDQAARHFGALGGREEHVRILPKVRVE